MPATAVEGAACGDGFSIEMACFSASKPKPIVPLRDGDVGSMPPADSDKNSVRLLTAR